MNDRDELEARIRDRILAKLELQSQDRVLEVLSQAGFIRGCERVLINARRTSRPGALLYTDVDRFRALNDEYGHATGDRILVGVADAIKTAAHEQALVGRWGGEEFVVLLPGVDEAEAVESANRIREGVQQLGLESDDGREAQATISIGVALYPRHGYEIVGLVERAERATALCKRLGRNQVQVYRAPPGPDNARAQIEELYDGILAEEAIDLSEGERQRLFESIAADVLGFGPLEPLLADGSVTEIMVDGYDRVYVERKGRLEDVPSGFRDNGHLMQVIYRILDAFGLPLDPRQPCLDTRLPDGSRMNVVIPPVSLEGPALTIRKFSTRPLTIEDMLRFNSLNEDLVRFLEACVRARLNLAIAGGTGSGKTTLLNGIAGMIPAGERVITVENAAEFRLPETVTHLVRLESRTPDWEGKGEVTMQDLIRNALRMRPDRIIVGEVRAGEVLDVLQAANSGHDGMLFSMHAAGPQDVLARLETMVMMANPALPLRNLRQLIASGIDLITWQERLRDGTRKMVKVSEVTGVQGEVIILQDLFEFRQTGYQEGRVVGYHTATGNVPKCLDRIREAGVDLPMDMFVAS